MLKPDILGRIRKIGIFISMLFTFLFVMEIYAQYGTSRRVARRTSRRTAARYSGGEYGYGGYGYGASAPGAGYVYTLPGGCALRAITGINYQYCGGAYYRPYYQGTTVVYQVMDESDLPQ